MRKRPTETVIVSCGSFALMYLNIAHEVYAHIPEEDRKVNAPRFEAGFYARADLRGLEPSFHTQIVQQPGADIA